MLEKLYLNKSCELVRQSAAFHFMNEECEILAKSESVEHTLRVKITDGHLHNMLAK